MVAKKCQGGSIMVTQKSARRKAGFGFTLIELMIAMAIVAILAAIALPSYASYVRKQKIRAAQGDLAGLVLMMENRFQQQLAYPGQPPRRRRQRPLYRVGLLHKRPISNTPLPLLQVFTP